MLDARTISDGIKLVNNQPILTTASTNRTRVAEEGKSSFGVLSDVGSVKIHVDTLVTEVGCRREHS